MLYYCANEKYIFNRLNQIENFNKISESLSFNNSNKRLKSKCTIESFLTEKNLLYKSPKSAVQGMFSKKPKRFVSFKLENASMGINPYLDICSMHRYINYEYYYDNSPIPFLIQIDRLIYEDKHGGKTFVGLMNCPEFMKIDILGTISYDTDRKRIYIAPMVMIAER